MKISVLFRRNRLRQERQLFSLSQNELKMLGHYDITQRLESVTRAHSIEYPYEDISRIRRSHEWLSLITTAGDAVVVMKTVDSNQIARHAANYRRDLLDNPLIEHRDEWGTRANQSRLAYSGSCESKRVECRHD